VLSKASGRDEAGLTPQLICPSYIPSHISLPPLPVASHTDLGFNFCDRRHLSTSALFSVTTFLSLPLRRTNMAEAAGLVVGVVSLASLLNNTLDCFEYVQLGRSFGKHYTTSQLRLDNARLRLSRWGKSIGLNEDPQDSTSLARHFDSEATIKHAEALLGQTLDLFAEAEGVSKKYKSRAQPDDGSLFVCNPQTDLDPCPAELHQKMRQLSLDRQNSSGLRQKVKWALYQEKQFRRLIEDIMELVDNLVMLFPNSQQYQRQLCDAEVSAVGGNEAISMLREIAADQDKLLNEALAKAKPETDKSHHIVFSGSHNNGLQIAHNAGTMSGFSWGGVKSSNA
jgi:hypothetical protein